MIGAEDDSEWAWEHDGVEVQPMSEFGGDDVLVNIGLLDRPDFMREIARSVALLGVGRPAISPTPYQALCLGVPFINPIMDVSRPAHSSPCPYSPFSVF
ncbi:hypothetical protein DL93DRAFT_1086859 [Clavulina sp. PMI_390]|nr:hypothetical protein DL93DRAFT_1086859 [Clavulina sp. PMI_390]